MELITTNQPLTMSSRDIAELCDKTHAHVMRDIRTMLEALEIEPQGYIQDWRHPKNHQVYQEFILCKRHVECLMLGYSPKLRIKVLERIEELEGKQAPALPANYVEALEHLLAAEKEKQLLIAAAKENEPKVEVYEALADRKQDVKTTVLAKQIGVSAQKLNTFLRDHGYKFKHGDMPTVKKPEWFNCIAGVNEATGHEYHQTLITPEGQVGIAKLWIKKNKMELEG